jgi:acetyltransferase-like isoleucine patch superfamily enzyme
MFEQYDYKLLKSCGEDVYISHNVEIRRPHSIDIGNHIAIDSGFYCTVAALIRDYIHIGPYVSIIGGARAFLDLAGFNTIGAGSRVLCASDEFLGAGLVGMSPTEYRDKIIHAPVIFKMFASVGTNVVIHPGVTLAEGSVVGSCSLVTKDTEPWTIYFGIPARPIKMRPKERMIEAAKAMGYI